LFSIHAFIVTQLQSSKFIFYLKKKGGYLIVYHGPKVLEQRARLQTSRCLQLIELTTIEIVWALPLQTNTYRCGHRIRHVQIGLRGEVVLEPDPSFMLIQCEH